MMMSVWKFAPALAAGNTVVLKPSDTTPASSYWMVEKMQDIFPPGVCNLVCGDRDTGAALTAHPIPQLVSITGSTGAGIAVATAAAKDLKRAHLELGGKAPVVVFDDADIEAAVEGISVAGLFNGGQDCTAATRVIVQQGVYDEFVAALTDAAKNTKTGYDPDDEDILYGPINNANQLGHVSGLVERAPDHARVTTGGHRHGRPRLLLRADRRRRPQAGRRADPDRDLRAGRSPSQKFTDEDEALQFANDSEYGLASSVWTEQRRHARRGWRPGSTSAASGSTPTSRWSARCRTAASSTPATARTCRCTGSRTTPASST